MTPHPYPERPGVPPAAPCACCGTTRGVLRTRTQRYRRLRRLCDHCYDHYRRLGQLDGWPRTTQSADDWLDDYRILAGQAWLTRAEIAARIGLTVDAMDRALTRARRRGDRRAVQFADVRT